MKGFTNQSIKWWLYHHSRSCWLQELCFRKTGGETWMISKRTLMVIYCLSCVSKGKILRLCLKEVWFLISYTIWPHWFHSPPDTLVSSFVDTLRVTWLHVVKIGIIFVLTTIFCTWIKKIKMMMWITVMITIKLLMPAATDVEVVAIYLYL